MFREIERGGLSTLHAPLNVWAVRFLQYLNGNYLGLSSITYEMHNRLLLELVPIGFLVILALKRRQHLWILALGWTLLAAAPYVAVVPPNATAQQAIQNVIGGDRYLYYSAAGASLLLVVSLMWLGSEIKRLHIVRLEQGYGLVAVTLMVVYLLANAARLLAYEKDWDTAGRIGQSVIAQVRQEAPAPANKEAMCFINLPDNFHGKYILRNGLAYALYLTYGQHDFDVRRYATTLQLADAEGTEKAQACTRVFVYDNVKQNLSRTR